MAHAGSARPVGMIARVGQASMQRVQEPLDAAEAARCAVFVNAGDGTALPASPAWERLRTLLGPSD